MEIRIEALTAEALEAFVNSELFQNMPVVPISRHRALSQIHNPQRRPDDILMFLAWAGNDLAGYLGVVPDTFNADNTRIHAGWLSCIWAKQAYRQYGISQKLLNAAMQEWQGNIIGSAYVPQIKSMYERAGFLTNYKALEGIKCYTRSNLAVLIPRHYPKYKTLVPLLAITDTLTNITATPLLKLFRKLLHKPAANTFNTIGLADTNINELISQCRHRQPETAARHSTDINWIIQYPWVSEKQAEYEPRYFFSSYNAECRFIALQSKDASGIINGFILLLLREGELKVQYIYTIAGAEKSAVTAIDAMVKQYGVHTISILHRTFAQHFMRHSVTYAFSKQSLRPFVISKTLAAKLTTFNLQPGDGDCAFT